MQIVTPSASIKKDTTGPKGAQPGYAAHCFYGTPCLWQEKSIPLPSLLPYALLIIRSDCLSQRCNDYFHEMRSKTITRAPKRRCASFEGRVRGLLQVIT